MAKALITSALPYINGIKHLGNLAGSLLPADIHARYRRQIGDETLFICATDEHGTPAELAAAEAGIDISDYCREQHELQADIYRRLNLSFDHFGRSSSAQNHALTQHFFQCLDEHGFIEERTLEQVYSPVDGRFLPDRYIVGTCPHCGFNRARGDQCERCTRPLDPLDLIEPQSALSGSTALEVRPTRHLFLRQSALVKDLEAWIDSRKGWPRLVTTIARKWLDEGIQDRCITRDLSWGVPVPKIGYEGKVFYVWFDAPIAYIAATQEWADIAPQSRDWRYWWWDPVDVDYIQFLGKDNVPFHAVSFPCTLIGSGEPWKTVDVIKGVNWLTYEGGKFSTSQRRGVFLDQALDLLPADYWRWWLASNAPENGDTDFSFERFAADVNNDLADIFGNLVNRTLTFLATRYDGVIPHQGNAAEPEERLNAELDHRLDALQSHHKALAFRKAADEVRSIWRLANGYLAAQAPWSVIGKDADRAAVIVRTGVNLVAIAATVAAPFIPETVDRVLEALGNGDRSWPPSLTTLKGGQSVKVPYLLFAKLTPEWVSERQQQFGGN
ncbi:methionine--tRNA ligase [Phyllobacterium zundukense]|uniref:Methionine--tRNA ligase n=1 Tax=Phyllobacterium zundukense TaxID=1867719 RepID=A0ACD4CYQ1_9HYPH|nr:methionine--tRNA ligase [Phyllobacterium zundukense]UXN58762.1 methionine--tRNA ligase [Phyllobacterium zundukense]